MTRPITGRQYEVLHAASYGETAEETAARLGIGKWTVKEYRREVLLRLGVRSISAAVAVAHQRRLL